MKSLRATVRAYQEAREKRIDRLSKLVAAKKAWEEAVLHERDMLNKVAWFKTAPKRSPARGEE